MVEFRLDLHIVLLQALLRVSSGIYLYKAKKIPGIFAHLNYVIYICHRKIKKVSSFEQIITRCRAIYPDYALSRTGFHPINHPGGR